MFAILQQKYPGSRPLKDRMLYSIGMSLFVFLFLLVFQPFQLGSSEKDVVWVCLGYGAICLLMMLLCNVVVIEFLPTYFYENNWTVGREIFWVFVNIVSIGFANAYFSSFIFHFPFTIKLIVAFELYTLAVAVLPVIVSVLIQFHRLRDRYEGNSEELNALFDQPHSAANDFDNQIISLNINNNESVQVPISKIYFIRAADNYVEVFYANGNTRDKVLIRNTLKSMLEDLKQYKNFFQVHRSYIANLHKVIYVSGNAQGLKLHYSNIEDTVPVSRKLTNEVKMAITIDHSK